jgi:hypothetical protein
MRAQEINMAIAEVCRWSKVQLSATGSKPKLMGIPPNGKTPQMVPDYQKDLNAMHEAENYLGVDREYNYGEQLRRISGNVGPKGGHFIPNGWGCFTLAHLGARKRAEAFLRTLGKWKE